MDHSETDVLVLGSGIAGLSYAINVAEALPFARITIITKTSPEECNTRFAQGGIAAVMDPGDNFENHVRDTLKAGDGLCDERIVRLVVKEGPHQIENLLRRGVTFDHRSNNSLDLAREGGHDRARVVHKGDYTGLEIESALLKKIATFKNIVILDHCCALDLITVTAKGSNNTKKTVCHGAYIADKNNSEVVAFAATVTVLATGGIGQLFQHTTNPPIATGDGIAMACRAGATVRDMEFLQYHPTALKSENHHNLFLISEAVRGCGAILRRKDGIAFMHRYDSRAELASRDIVARAITTELEKQGDDCVYLDCTMIPREKFREKFPVILKKCLESGIDPLKNVIPVIPAMHYLCGGIKTDDNGRTTLGNLYACGECASTGLHGANRLASNSLLEAVVFAKRAAEDSIRNINSQTEKRLIVPDKKTFYFPTEKVAKDLLTELKKTMQSLGLKLSDKKLKNTNLRLNQLKEKTNAHLVPAFNQAGAELMNLLIVASLVLGQSSKRTSNKGGFFNEDLQKQEVPSCV